MNHPMKSVNRRLLKLATSDAASALPYLRQKGSSLDVKEKTA